MANENNEAKRDLTILSNGLTTSDSDTIGAMAGAIAACCYEIPQSLIERCNAILTEDLREIQNEFEKLIEARNNGVVWRR